MSTYPELLRALADLIEENDLVEPNLVTTSLIQIHSHGDTAPTDLAKWRRALGGTWGKNGYDTFITLNGKAAALPGAPRVNLFIDKDRCVRKVVGQEDVIVPAVEASPARIEQRDIIEYDCEPLLAGVNA